MKNTQIWELLSSEVPSIRSIFIGNTQILLLIAQSAEKESSWKTILAEYLPNFSIEVGYELMGKPILFLNGVQQFFNVTHTKDLYVFAFAQYGEIGIDAELSQRKVHPRLHRRIVMEDDRIEQASDIEIWTMKEAVLKGIGTGLRHAMNKVSMIPVDEEIWQLNPGNTYGKYLGKFVRFEAYTIAVCTSEFQ